MQVSSSYPQRVRNAILPLSVADNLPSAFGEWQFTGVTEDYLTPSEICELCGQDDLRYHFEIQNDFTQSILNVGSHCILKFDLRVYEEGKRLTAKDAKRLLDKLTQKMRLESCVGALEKLCMKENNPVLDSALKYYRLNKKLTPKFAFVVFWKLREYDIDHHASFFSINLKKQRFVNDLKEMPTTRVHFFWSALSSAQKKKAIELGHQAPYRD